MYVLCDAIFLSVGEEGVLDMKVKEIQAHTFWATEKMREVTVAEETGPSLEQSRILDRVS